MPHFARRALRVALWTAFCAVAALYLWHQAQTPLNAEATRLELIPRSERFGAVELSVWMFATPAGRGGPGSGVLRIYHGGGSWMVSLPDLRLVEADMGSPQPGRAPPARYRTPPLTEAGLARLLTPSEWPSRDAEFTADMDELWSLVQSSPSGGLSTRVRRFSIRDADPWQRPVWARSNTGVLWLVLIWAVGVAVLWGIGSESPSDQAIAEAITAERSRLKRLAVDPRRPEHAPVLPRPFRDTTPSHPPRARWPDQVGRPTVDYRTPIPGGETIERVLHELGHTESLDRAGAAAKLALGVTLCLVPPLLVTLLVESGGRLWAGDQMTSVGIVFLLVSVVLVPALFWLERRTGGHYFLDAVRGTPDPASASTRREFEVRRNDFLWTCYTEIALAGPRLVWEFIDWARGRPPVDPSTRIVAAQIAHELLVEGEGLPLSALLRADRPRTQVAAAIRYLVAREWVGVSRNRDRAWLSSRTSARLAEVLGSEPQASPRAGAPHSEGHASVFR